MDDIRHGDCLEYMKTMEPNSVDAIVTDPPYGLSFMGKDWDHGIPGIRFWKEALRVAKPGAHLLAFGGTRTFHRLTCAIEDAGWEIRDCLGWLYGSGFPKSHNLKGEHEGWGTALKPAWEPIILARKPLDGTVAANVQKWGTGAVNVDGCRVGTADNLNGGGYDPQGASRKDLSLASSYATKPMPKPFVQPAGRWPANIIHDGSDEVLELFPQAKGNYATRGESKDGQIFGYGNDRGDEPRGFGDSGSAARFFYCAKASRREREAGLDGMPQGDRVFMGSGGRTQVDGEGVETHSVPRLTKNPHPTVKPVALMRYLCRLVTPPNGLILDPFCGSGTTGIAAKAEGFRFIGIDNNEEYCEIAERRISSAGALMECQI